MGNYYCLVAGLPEIAFDGSKPPLTIENFREEVYSLLSADDTAYIDLFFYAWDNDNLLDLLEYGEDIQLEKRGCFSKEELMAIIAAAKEGDMRDDTVPEYLYDFLEYYFANVERNDILWEDSLAAYYYSYAISSKSKFISKWFTFNLNVNNIFTAYSARKYKLNVADCVIGDDEITETIRTSGAKDFGLTGTLDYLEQVLRLCDIEDMQQREREVDEMRWEWLDDNSVFNYFTVERLFVYLQKLDILNRWAKLDADKGMERYKEIIGGLKNVSLSFD